MDLKPVKISETLEKIKASQKQELDNIRNEAIRDTIKFLLSLICCLLIAVGLMVILEPIFLKISEFIISNVILSAYISLITGLIGFYIIKGVSKK